MEEFFLKCLIVVIAYFIGTIPFGLLVTRQMGSIGLTHRGSGNIGATNVLRVVGKKAALLTLLGDLGKGVLAVFLMSLVSKQEEWKMASALAVVLGHVYPLFRRGKGGKGVATGFGVLIILDIWTALATFLVWLCTVAIWRYASLGALISFLLLPLIVYGLTSNPTLLIFAICLSSLVVIRHWSNLQRLLAGKEHRIGC